MNKQAQVEKVLKCRTIPPGQLCIYKALLEGPPEGLRLPQLAATNDRSVQEMQSTLGALGNRVTQCLGTVPGSPSRLLIHKDGHRYRLAPELLSFIEATPSLQAALRDNPMSKFHRHTKKAWEFRWNDQATGGQLQEFERK
jgi:hypothetical protein